MATPPAQIGMLGTLSRCAETVALVLDEEAPVLDSAQDVTDLGMRLRGHLMQLGPLTAARTTSDDSLHKALAEAQRLAEEEAPADFMPARVHLRHFAQAVQEVMDQLSPEETASPVGTRAAPDTSEAQQRHAAGGSSECPHRPNCPASDASNWEAAHVSAHCPELGYSLLCNGSIFFADTGGLLPDGRVISPHRPTPASRTAVGVHG